MDHFHAKGGDDFERYGIFDKLVDLAVVDIPGLFDRHLDGEAALQQPDQGV